MNNKFWLVVKWVLFWWYLIPYTVFKKYVFHKSHQTLYSALSSVAVVFIGLCVLAGALGSSDSASNSTEQKDQVKTHVVTKKVGTDKLKKSKAKQKILAAQKSEKQKEYNKLKDQLDDQKQKQEDQKREQEEAAEKQAKAQKAAQEKQKQDENQNHQAPTNNGDMNTASTGKIVGNSRSHIYHVPGQAGYRMNSANAVYFNSEQEAINAGYRKAKR